MQLQHYGLIGVLTLMLAVPLPTAAAPRIPPPPLWVETPVMLPAEGPICVDGALPNRILVNENQQTVAYDWTTGQRTTVANRPFETCLSDGTRYLSQTPGSALLFDIDGQTKDSSMPLVWAEDGSRWRYMIAPDNQGTITVSSDAGIRWLDKAMPDRQLVEAVAVSRVDGMTVYAVATDRNAPAAAGQLRWTLLRSQDAGTSWEVRSSETVPVGAPGFPFISISTIPGDTTADGVLLRISTGSGSGSRPRLALSNNGGRSFIDFVTGIDQSAQVVGSTEGYVVMTNTGRSVSLRVYPYNGREPYQVPRPAELIDGPGAPPELLATEAAPGHLFLRGPGLWHSPDGGFTWRMLSDLVTGPVWITPYQPLSILTRKSDGRLLSLYLGETGRGTATPTAWNGVGSVVHSPETGHSIAPLFQTYWHANGGLSLFGLPRTGSFREVNETDGRIYTVQYFERNRFEYHPEQTDERYQVLLGLLGARQTQNRRQEAPFVPVTAAPAGAALFPETGHTLGGVFYRYWQNNGGLAVYGYPISEPFQEVNPEDGNTYTVQYFERNRFEYHPELAGTRYEVLLGLLGNDLLREKGWLPR